MGRSLDLTKSSSVSFKCLLVMIKKLHLNKYLSYNKFPLNLFQFLMLHILILEKYLFQQNYAIWLQLLTDHALRRSISALGW